MSRLQRTRRSCRQRDGKAMLRDRLQVFQFCVQTSCKRLRIGAGLQKKKRHSEWRFLVLFLFLIGSTTARTNAHSRRCHFTNPDPKVIAVYDLFEPLHYVANEHHYDSVHGRSDGTIAMCEEVFIAILCLTFHGRRSPFLKRCGLTSLSVPFLKNFFTNRCVFTFHFYHSYCFRFGVATGL